jgi:hypothetical protein
MTFSWKARLLGTAGLFAAYDPCEADAIQTGRLAYFAAPVTTLVGDIRSPLTLSEGSPAGSRLFLHRNGLNAPLAVAETIFGTAFTFDCCDWLRV